MRARAAAWMMAAALWLCAMNAAAQHHHHDGRDEASASDGAVRDAVVSDAVVGDAAVGDASVSDAAVTSEAVVASDEALTAVPTGRGLPVIVQVATQFVEVRSIEENDETFTGTVDVRLQWDDLRLAYPAGQEVGAFREWRGAAAEARLGEIWWPEVELTNVVDEPASQTRGLRIYPSGHVEVMQRTRATFRSAFDASRFPFDAQRLQVVLESPRAPLAEVAFDFRQDDLDFSRAANEAEVGGWRPELVTLRREPLGGWHGDLHARVYAELGIARMAARTAPAIFIPLLASLLIPLLAVWLNRVQRGSFAVEAFELTNVVVGGLFAVIALNFTVNAEYKVIAAGDNTVSRLFALNYVTLGVSLVVNMALYRFNLVRRWFGPTVQEQVFRVCVWAIPLLSLATAAAIVAAAMA